MKAIALKQKTHALEFVELREPQIERDDEVKLKVLETGICGTDRALIEEREAQPPQGENLLILGHEMLGEVVAVGKKVTSLKPGDLAVATVRRGCSRCTACLSDNADMCTTGAYTERGIKGRHGFFTECVVDVEKNIIPVPQHLRKIGVLCEPLSAVTKGIEEILACQYARLSDWQTPEDFSQKQALVVGLGSIGLLACLDLKLRGFKVYGQDVVEPDSAKVEILEAIQGRYIDGRKIEPRDFPKLFGSMDLIVEAAGIAELHFLLLDALGPSGGCVMLGVPDHKKHFSIEGGRLMRDLVFKNQIILGSVNAGLRHWKIAVRNLQNIEAQWPGLLSKLITLNLPYTQFPEAVFNRHADEIKCILTWETSK